MNKALKAYDERMGKGVEKCREELEKVKKDLHELIDMRIGMAVAFAELAENAPGGAYSAPGAGYVQATGQPARKHQEARRTRGCSARAAADPQSAPVRARTAGEPGRATGRADPQQ